jgi:hypothetical protein
MAFSSGDVGNGGCPKESFKTRSVCGGGEKRMWGNLDLATGVDLQPYLKVHIYRAECSRLFVISTPTVCEGRFSLTDHHPAPTNIASSSRQDGRTNSNPKIRPMSSTPSSSQLLGQRFSWMKMDPVPQKDSSTSCNIPNPDTVISSWYHNLRSLTPTIPIAGRLSRSGQSLQMVSPMLSSEITYLVKTER